MSEDCGEKSPPVGMPGAVSRHVPCDATNLVTSPGAVGRTVRCYLPRGHEHQDDDVAAGVAERDPREHRAHGPDVCWVE